MHLEDEIGCPGLDLVQESGERTSVKRPLREAREAGEDEQPIQVGVVLSHER